MSDAHLSGSLPNLLAVKPQGNKSQMGTTATGQAQSMSRDQRRSMSFQEQSMKRNANDLKGRAQEHQSSSSTSLPGTDKTSLDIMNLCGESHVVQADDKLCPVGSCVGLDTLLEKRLVLYCRQLRSIALDSYRL